MEQLAQRHLHLARVRQLDPDRVLARNRRENIDPLRARRARQVAFERHDLVHPHAFGRINFVARDRRTFGDITRRDRDPELRQRLDQDLLDLLQLRWIGRGPALGVVFVQEIKSGQRVVFRVPGLTR